MFLRHSSLYECLLCHDECQVATFADDTAILTSDKDPVNACYLLQNHLNKMNIEKWRMKIIEGKSQPNLFKQTNKSPDYDP